MPITPTTSIRLPTALRKALEARAKAEGRTLANLILYLINKGMQ